MSSLSVGLRRQLAERQRPSGAAVSRPRLRQRLHQAGHDRQPLDASQRRRRRTASERPRWRCPATPTTATSSTDTLNGDINEDSLDQAIYQPSAAEQAALAAAGYTGFPTSGANAGQHAVSVLALHRQRAAQRRAGREVQRPDQPHARRRSTTAARSASSRCATRSARGGNQFTAGGALDRSRVGFVAVHRARLSQSRSQRHRRRRVRRWRDRRRGRRRAVRHARRSRRPDPDLEPLRDRHAVDRATRGTSRCRAATTARRSSNRDRIEPGGGPGSLDGDHAFSRFNPAAGVTFSPSRTRQRLRRLQRRQPRGDVDRARLRRSRTSPASCPTRWPAIRRSTRS